MKRSDIPTTTVLFWVQEMREDAFDVLCSFAPKKVVYRAFERDERSGYLESGVSGALPWITPKGKQLLAEVLNGNV